MFKKDNKGFTIIEVLIVLAIAGLILLIVFLAVPALQRNSRNTSRNNDAARVSALVTECLANRNGDISLCDTSAKIGFDQPDFSILESVSFSSTNQATEFGTNVEAVVNYKSLCQDGGASDKASGTSQRQFTVSYVNETDVNRCIGSE